ncbi:DUF262 domain-containing protein [Stenotrophomonas rhizophila]|uniref:GmrSD restriction endonucleases N-terminal domain-containing protein n=1 Tax=Stenotrophomonas rhizophila TaxID=216778 RepID=A0AAW5PL92_9GAMM|nr:DUF262 domain-containing protein [Stenotrophomonas rhizophila]MCS4281105.1 hypothetical protein [Stenotrophomonas rhizophila]
MATLSVTTAKPDIVSVSELLEAVASGEYRIPKFQRPYIWTPDDMLQLFDSVLKGYPIGSLLIWQTEREGITSLDNIGPTKITDEGPRFKCYVVDGHQRLATLFGVLTLEEGYPRERQDQWRWSISYDLKEEAFVHMKPSQIAEIHHLPLRSILRTSDFARRTRSIAASSELSERQISQLLDRADFVQRAIREYRVPMTIMKSGSLDDAVTIFARVNQRGREMTADQMISALTYREDETGAFDLAAHIDELLAKLRRYGHADLPRKVILQVVLALGGMDFTRPSYEKVVEKSSSRQMRFAVRRAGFATRDAARFLRDNVGLRTSRLLPYSGIFVLLAIFFGKLRSAEGAVNDLQTRALVRWFWATSFNGWFAGATTTDLRLAADAMESFATLEDESGLDVMAGGLVRRIPSTFDRRSARVRASLLMQLLACKPLDPITGEEIDGASVFSSEGSSNIPYFFSKADRPYVSSPANRVILPQGYSRSAWAQFLKTPENISGSVMRSHLISKSAYEALLKEDSVEFIRIREVSLAKAEAKFLAAINVKFDGNSEQPVEEFDAE